jgi:hypothetical protein
VLVVDHRVGNERLWYWQGLRWAPGGLVFLTGVALAPLAGPVRWLGWIAVLLAAARLHTMAGRYYASRFGEQRLPQPGDAARWGALYATVGAAVTLDAWWSPMLFLTGPVSAVALLAYRASTGGGRPHYRGAAGLLAILAVLPILGIIDNGRPMLLVWMVVVGVLYIGLGLLDHRQYTLRAAAVHDADNAVDETTASFRRWRTPLKKGAVSRSAR